MDFETQGQQLEQTYEHYIILFIRYLISALQFSIPLVTGFAKTHPTAFLVVTSVILLYLSWKILRNIFIIIRRLFFTYLLFACVMIYLRGWDQFIFNDVPYLSRFVNFNLYNTKILNINQKNITDAALVGLKQMKQIINKTTEFYDSL